MEGTRGSSAGAVHSRRPQRRPQRLTKAATQQQSVRLTMRAQHKHAPLGKQSNGQHPHALERFDTPTAATTAAYLLAYELLSWGCEGWQRAADATHATHSNSSRQRASYGRAAAVPHSATPPLPHLCLGLVPAIHSTRQQNAWPTTHTRLIKRSLTPSCLPGLCLL